ncbi:DUF192 domain-containing protein [Patescibacteria group bacterium]|nr:DUF192 domain-containing protein [Patescibacteria group bacterium]
MSQRRDKSTSFLIYGLAVIAALYVVSILIGPHAPGIFSTPISAPLGTIHAAIATTSADQEKGLGDRDQIAADQGMLFAFNAPGDYGFWMKDMRFPLDMVWILSNKKVTGVTYDIPADSYPTVFYPPLAVSYVLELPAGSAAKFGIATGTQLGF